MLTGAIRTGISIDYDEYEQESSDKKHQARLMKNVKQQEAVEEILKNFQNSRETLFKGN